MAKIIWSPTALTDVNAIAEYISRDSPEHASLFIERLLEQTSRLADFPHSGRVIKEINDDNSREIIYGSYRIMYLIKDDEIWITGIVHGARDWNP
ncbi:type II toxin-antitoxin system RelE/ParE family toxin [candidate division CSSED10-310 bacterium]|uniref:Type II toxin-antitoxin system RelE/ParE family toxin n=1 Tax=candidate division CSSED10-310 bacterium TaxID=2855610 RepID=A0ABV6YTM5_UNCC1